MGRKTRSFSGSRRRPCPSTNHTHPSGSPDRPWPPRVRGANPTFEGQEQARRRRRGVHVCLLERSSGSGSRGSADLEMESAKRAAAFRGSDEELSILELPRHTQASAQSLIARSSEPSGKARPRVKGQRRRIARQSHRRRKHTHARSRTKEVALTPKHGAPASAPGMLSSLCRPLLTGVTDRIRQAPVCRPPQGPTARSPVICFLCSEANESEEIRRVCCFDIWVLAGRVRGCGTHHHHIKPPR